MVKTQSGLSKNLNKNKKNFSCERFLIFFCLLFANDKHLAPKVQKDFLRQQEERVFDRRPYRDDLLKVYRVCDLYYNDTIMVS